MESVRKVEDEAAAWLVRRDAGNWSANDQAELDRWLESATENVVAFVRLETAWQRTHRLKALGDAAQVGLLALTSEAPRRRRLATAHRYGLAAGILVAIAIGLAVYLWPAEAATYRTPVGGMASVPMADGSRITLNTDSEIRIDVSETVRRVEIERGEAFFQVATDPRRPFIVNAGDKRVIAVGTAFSVRRDEDDVHVVVTEGIVKVVPAAEKRLPRLSLANGQSPQEVTITSGSGSDANAVILIAGSVARSQGGDVILEQKAAQEVEEALSWRTGFLTFRETTLAEAVVEFNRYNRRKIYIEDPGIAAIRLSGRFESTQYEAFIRLLEGSFPIRVERTDERVVLANK